MKYSFLHRTYSVTLSVLVLFSTFCFTVEKHYCGDHLVDTAIFSEAKKCGNSDSKDVTYVKKSCCKDTVEVLEGQDALSTVDFEHLEKIQKQVLIAYSFSYVSLLEDFSNLVYPYIDYVPPKISKDIHLLNELYLI